MAAHKKKLSVKTLVCGLSRRFFSVILRLNRMSGFKCMSKNLELYFFLFRTCLPYVYTESGRIFKANLNAHFLLFLSINKLNLVVFFLSTLQVCVMNYIHLYAGSICYVIFKISAILSWTWYFFVFLRRKLFKTNKYE